MIIVHGPIDIACQGQILATAQREIGHPSFFVGIAPTRKFKYRFIDFPAIAIANVMDLHFATVYLQQRDLAMLKKMGKKIICHCHGCDVRYFEEGMDFPLNACYHCYTTRDAPRKKRVLEQFRKFADAFVVTTPDLLEFVPEASYIPTAILTKELRTAEDKTSSGPLRIFHASTNPLSKGTGYIKDALAPLIKAGKVTLSIVQNATHEDVLRAASDADLAIDQMLVGWYGVFATEMMAMGIPVICYIRKELIPWQPNVPIIRADPWSLAGVVEQLIADDKLRKEVSQRGRRFVEQVHDSHVVGNQLIKLYESL